MTVSEVIKALQALLDSGVISPEYEIRVHDVTNEEYLEIFGYDIYADGTLNLKAREA